MYKFSLENTEIPIIRGMEALTSKRTKALELPANKQTLYSFGNVFSIDVPKNTKKQGRTKSKII